MRTTKIFMIAASLVALGLLGYWYTAKTAAPVVIVSEPVGIIPNQITNSPIEKSEAVIFSGTLNEVNMGCEIGGECYVVVDGKHITTFKSEKLEVAGDILGAEGGGLGMTALSDLEYYIGTLVEVYAQPISDGTYSLYGSDDYYIQVKEVSETAALNSGFSVLGMTLTPLELIEDSRCPYDVVCIQAGTVRVRATLVTPTQMTERTFTLGIPVSLDNFTVTLKEVAPQVDSRTNLKDSDYLFTFTTVAE